MKIRGKSAPGGWELSNRIDAKIVANKSPTLAAKDAARMGHPAKSEPLGLKPASFLEPDGTAGSRALPKTKNPTLAAKDAARMGHPDHRELIG